MASWHRFFLDFGGFWDANWEGNWSQDRPKKASKNDAKKRGSEIAKKSRNKTLQPRAPEMVLGPGEGVRGKSLRTVVYAKPPQPKGWWAFDNFFMEFH